MRTSARVSLALALLAFAALPLDATIPPTALAGHVHSNGKPVAGATVTIASRTTQTTPDGMYWVEDVIPGSYDVTFAHAGMKTVTKRVVVKLAHVARADAVLDPSEDEENVTSTATMTTVADTQPLTTHVSDRDLDAFPIWRSPTDAAIVVAGYGPVYAPTLVDDVYTFEPYLLGPEALEEVTVIRGAAPVELEWYGSTVAKTRTGGNAFAFSLRDTLTSASWIQDENDRYARFLRKPRGGGVDHFVEATAGGPISRDNLWFFASIWRGGQNDGPIHNVNGYEAKLTSQLGRAHSVTATFIDGSADSPISSIFAVSQGQLRYSGVLSATTTIEAVAARSTATFSTSLYGGTRTALAVDDSVFAKGTHVWSSGSHEAILSAGVRATPANIDGTASLFGNSRWSSSDKLILNVGGRIERGSGEIRVRPRLSATWDVRGDGRRALIAAFGDYANPLSPDSPVHEALVGYASAIGSTGTFRADVTHRRFESAGQHGFNSNTIHLESAYRLFERFYAGGLYEYVDQRRDAFPPMARHTANAWFSMELPFDDRTLGITVLERFSELDDAYYDTDLSLRYTIPVGAVALTTAADVQNVFNNMDFAGGRVLRLWVRARL